MSPERPGEEPGREHEPLPYYHAVRFQREGAARQAYFATQDAIYKVECNISTYRFLLRGIWHVAVIGEPPPEELDQQLRQARNFKSRIAMASTLDRIGVEELRQMVDFRWRVASGNQDHPFHPDAIDALYVASGGTPREACIIADNALLLAFLSGEKTITKALIETATKERVTNIGTLSTKRPKRAS